jgi:hypothetical protein
LLLLSKTGGGARAFTRSVSRFSFRLARWSIRGWGASVLNPGVKRLAVDLRPLAEFFEYRPERETVRGEASESGCEDAGRDMLRLLEELGEGAGALGDQVSDDEHGPLVPEYVHGALLLPPPPDHLNGPVADLIVLTKLCDMHSLL